MKKREFKTQIEKNTLASLRFNLSDAAIRWAPSPSNPIQ